MLAISFSSHPLKIVDMVILFIAIFVINHKRFVFFWLEGHKNNAVNIEHLALSVLA